MHSLANRTLNLVASHTFVLLIIPGIIFAQPDEPSFATMYASKALRVEKDEVPDDIYNKTHHWTAYRGTERLREEQFLRLVGNYLEARESTVQDSTNAQKMNIGAGMFLGGGSVGLIGSLALINETRPGDDPKWNSPSGMLTIGGILVGSIGWAMMKDALYRPKQISYDQARMAAENYNDALRMEYGLHLMKQQQPASAPLSNSLHPVPPPDPGEILLPDSTEAKPRGSDDSLFLWVD